MKNAAKKWRLQMIGAAAALVGIIVLATYLLPPANAEERMNVQSPSANKAQLANSEVYTAYIEGMRVEDGKLMLSVDKIGWYQGEEANTVFKQRNPDAGIDEAPDGYYIVNDNKEQEQVEVKADAKVLMQLYDHDGTMQGAEIKWNEPVSLSKFEALYGDTRIMDLSVFPYHLTIQDGKVIQIVQQYIP
ncbi:hypothetical protein HUB98_28920 [Paenibacillus barcinonensis]|uniref:Uncharacterized protein n=1 Tax=Paenibacillus barcinonensis TaxID=198119 RepID=A0A2V4VAG2_PAEBA|nr:hypothetical protein [Paenibacillus barcinonensis]PYE50096.1 hypothetical protein DFQ00_10454 [Paenibacillus barcinonensis]QKS59833.1 hypothetical protein HUB98_28920 [Paenibacillus barcinonensis]